MTKRLICVLLVALVLASCAPSESAVQTAIAQTQAVAGSNVAPGTQAPSPVGTELPPEEDTLLDADGTPGPAATGTDEELSDQPTATSTPRRLSVRTPSRPEDLKVAPYGVSAEWDFPIVLILVLVILLVFLSLNREEQGPDQ